MAICLFQNKLPFQCALVILPHFLPFFYKYLQLYSVTAHRTLVHSMVLMKKF